MTSAPQSPKVLIFGAGAIGGYLGGALAAQGLNTTFLIRPKSAVSFRQFGLTLTDYENRHHLVEKPVYITSLELLDFQPDIVLLTVKCGGVSQAAQELGSVIGEQTQVVCLQNGIGSVERAAEYLPSRQLLHGMVPFNVVKMDEGRLHRGTEGVLKLESHPSLQPLCQAWTNHGIPVEMVSDFDSVSWGKLLLNLNNAINALADVPLVEELSDRSYRRVLSACMSELLRALKVAEIRPAKLTKAPPFLVPWILRLPNWLFRFVAQSMLKIDPLARSSMWDDLQTGRTTEIDFLNQAVVDLATSLGLEAPVNQGVVDLIKLAEESKEGSPRISGQELVARLLTS